MVRVKWVYELCRLCSRFCKNNRQLRSQMGGGGWSWGCVGSIQHQSCMQVWQSQNTHLHSPKFCYHLTIKMVKMIKIILSWMRCECISFCWLCTCLTDSPRERTITSHSQFYYHHHHSRRSPTPSSYKRGNSTTLYSKCTVAAQSPWLEFPFTLCSRTICHDCT